MSVNLFSSTLGDMLLVPAWPNAGAPTSGTSGTLAGYAQPGDLLVDTTNHVLYMNTNTQASPTWTQIGVNQAAVAITGGTINGTVIGGTTPAAGAFTFVKGSYATGLAAVGTNVGTALQLVAQVNRVTTAASSAVGVILPSAATVGVGGTVTVINDGPSNSFHVYGNGSDTIDGAAAGTGVVLTNAFQCAYQVDAAGAWVSYRSAVTRSA